MIMIGIGRELVGKKKFRMKRKQFEKSKDEGLGSTSCWKDKTDIL